MTENQPDKLEVIACRHCHAIFGYSDGLYFYLTPDKAFRLRLSITAECMTCRKLVYWNVRRKTKEQLIAVLQTG